MQHVNHNTSQIFTPVNADELERLLIISSYDRDKTQFLVNGFKQGFDIGYRNDKKVKLTALNLKFTIGNELELWNKVMKEVELKRYAGPFETIPFDDDFIQSPIGLVPKDSGTKTRLIFHLSYPKESGISVNARTPAEMTTVSYPDFDEAIKLCLKEGKFCYIGKSDFSAAFRHLPIKPEHWRYLVMKAKSPIDGKYYYFFDKCLPFGASVSCSHFQAFSDAISHIMKYLSKKSNVNYLDDFLFAAFKKLHCDEQLKTFLWLCEKIRFPVSADKTFWGARRLSFLGLLIDTAEQRVRIPEDKRIRAINMIMYVLNKVNKKITLRQLQKLCGFLNFLNKCVIPGRAFTRRLYAHGNKLSKPHHHLDVTREMRLDLELWLNFLLDEESAS